MNKNYGCPHSYLRYQMSSHLPVCPASVVVCSSQWNRWALGAKEREKVTLQKGTTALFDSKNIGTYFIIE